MNNGPFRSCGKGLSFFRGDLNHGKKEAHGNKCYENSVPPALENTLHKYFKKQEVNKVNQRKEFFKVNLEEIKELVHNEYNNTVHFTDLAAAEQYFESLKIEQQETAG